MALNESFEVLEALDGVARGLIDEHRERRQHWLFHDLVPWERGENFKDKPWDASQATISEEARNALVLNLLTEDNLPYYHSAFESKVQPDSALGEWNRLWTAEENQHAIAMRSYLLVSRNADPVALEMDRMATMQTGWFPVYPTPAHLFAYTSFQELATRVSHRNAGKISDDEACTNLMRLIAGDENHHFIFYKSMLAAMLDTEPNSTLKGIYETLVDFQMPGIGIPRFLRRSLAIAKSGVYNMRLHHDRVIMPLLKDWGVGALTDLDPVGAEYQQKIMDFPDTVLEQAERFEKRFGLGVV